MKRFVFATYDCFENELKQEVVHAQSAVEVLKQKLFPNGEELPDGVECTVESLVNYAYGCDMPMSILEVEQDG